MVALTKPDHGSLEGFHFQTASLFQVVEERWFCLSGRGAEKFDGFFGEILRQGDSLSPCNAVDLSEGVPQ